MKQGDSKKPGEGEVLTTGGEASAAGYVAAEVPAGKDCPTIDVARVRIVPPSQTPTVKLGDVAKGAGPRAPEQMVRPKPKGLVELPEGRAVTKMQRIEIDPEFLLGLEQGLIEGDEGGAAKTGGEEAAEGPPAEMVSEPVKRRGRSGMVMAVAIGVTVVVGVIAAMMPRRGPEPNTRGSATAVPSATVVPNATATVTPPALPTSTELVAAPPASATSPAALPPASVTAHAPERPRVVPQPSSDADDPYADASVKPLPVAPAPAVPKPVAPSPAAATSSKVMAPTPEY